MNFEIVDMSYSLAFDVDCIIPAIRMRTTKRDNVNSLLSAFAFLDNLPSVITHDFEYTFFFQLLTSQN